MSSGAAQIDSTIEIVTPENIAFQYQAAGPFLRLPAFLIDLMIRFSVMALSLIGLGIAGMFVLGPFVGALLFLLWFVLEWFYGGLFETYWNGQTPGKRLLGIRVLSVGGQPINGLQAVMRNILRYVDMMPSIPMTAFGLPPFPLSIPTFLIGLVTPMMNQRYQRLGDLVCGTMVIVEERSWLRGVTRVEDPRASALASLLPGSFRASRSLARALAAYVEGRRYFSTARRREIARHLGAPLAARLGLPADTSHDLLLCALYYRTFIADRLDETAP